MGMKMLEKNGMSVRADNCLLECDFHVNENLNEYVMNRDIINMHLVVREMIFLFFKVNITIVERAWVYRNYRIFKKKDVFTIFWVRISETE